MKEQLNYFFVTTFDRILSLEERELQKSQYKNLSVKEFHVLDGVDKMEKTGKNTMSAIAGKMGISLGALTTAMNTLVKKGYVCRNYPKEDRRLVQISLTELGKGANKVHQRFHNTMIEKVSESLSTKEIETLSISLKKMNDFLKREDLYD